MALISENTDFRGLHPLDTSNTNLDTFTNFALLPKELQLKVWSLVSPQARLIIIIESGNLSSPIIQRTRGLLQGPPPLKSRYKVSPLLHTCVASRFIALQSHQSAFGLPIFANFDADIFYFPSAARYHHFPILVENHPDAAKVRNVVAVGNEEWPGIDWYLLAHRVLPNLNHVFMIKQSLMGASNCRIEAEEKEKESKAFEMLVRSSASILSEHSYSRAEGDESNRASGRTTGAGFMMMFEEEFKNMLEGV